MNRHGRWLLATLFLLTFQCTGFLDPFANGGVSETTNGRVVGRVKTSGGAPALNTKVVLRPADFNPVDDAASGLVDTTDENGGYVFDGVEKGDYTVQSVQPGTGLMALLTGINVGRDTVTAALSTLEKPGSITIRLPAGVDNINGYVYVPGTDISAFLADNSGSVVLDPVPAVTIPAIVYGVLSSPVKRIMRNIVSVISGENTLVALPFWKYSKTLVLNTTASGADVAGDVTGFPALVRLTPGNFDFTQARPDGGDVRFARADGSPIPHEIEQWDAAGNRAAIWVRVDTIRGNNASQSISMFWGNAGAANNSAGGAVFDTSIGFQGVWHLGQPRNTIALDATVNRYNGTPYGMNAASSVTGAIGSAQEFDGSSSYFTMDGTAAGRLDFPENGSYTISAWVYADTFTIGNSAFYTIAAKGNQQYNLEIYLTGEWEFAQYTGKKGWEMTSSPAMARTWTYLTGVRRGTAQYLYINGICVDSIVLLYPSAPDRSTDNDVTIGKNSGWSQGNDNFPYFFDGKIDEVRMSNLARGRDWEKLCYMNQRSDDRLVMFR